MSLTIKYKVHDFAKDIGKKSTEILELLNKYDLTTLGTIPKDDLLKENRVSKESSIVKNAIEQLYYRLNIPQQEEIQ